MRLFLNQKSFRSYTAVIEGCRQQASGYVGLCSEDETRTVTEVLSVLFKRRGEQKTKENLIATKRGNGKNKLHCRITKS